VDRLVELSLVRRLADPRDRRSIHIDQVREGVGFLGDIRRLLAKVAKDVRADPKTEEIPQAAASKGSRRRTRVSDRDRTKGALVCRRITRR
jgi:DNA-binding MarR family transcriptional regulator